DHIHGALSHAVGELLDGDDLRNGDFAHELFLGLAAALTFQSLHPAAECGDRTFALLVGFERGDDRQAAAPLLGTGTRRLGGGSRAGDTAGATTRRARRLVIIRLQRDRSRGSGHRSLGLFVLAETLLGFLLGLALGFLVVPAALFFLAL